MSTMSKPRFNENLEFNKQTKKDDAMSTVSKAQKSIDLKSVITGRAQSSYHKKRKILDSGYGTDMQKNLNIEENNDKMSVITTDKLKKFNEIYGYENGPAVDV